MKIAVCDDMPADRDKLSNYISIYARKNMLDIQIENFSSGEKLLSDFEASHIKVIFLDIFMEKISGIETAFRIRETDPDCVIIFATTSPDYRAEGFEVGAIHYLVKPLSCIKVEQALNRCKRLFVESEKYFTVTVDRHEVPVRFRDILYIEVYNKYVLIHTENSALKTYITLSKIAEMLDGGQFLRCHRCYIVNMYHISGVLEDSFQLDSGEKVPIHRKGRQEIKDEYTRYFLTSLRGNDNV